MDLNKQVFLNLYTGCRAITSIYKDVYGNDITPQNIFTLELCELHHKIIMSELSKGLNLNSSAVSALVTRMEKKGLLERTFSTIDRRIVFVSLTKKGNEFRNLIREKMDLLNQSITEDLSQMDIEKLYEIITTIKNNSLKKRQNDSKSLHD